MIVIFDYVLEKILRRDSLNLPASISAMFHHIATSMIISSCFACGMLAENISEILVNSKNVYLSSAYFRLRKIVFTCLLLRASE